MNRRDEEAIRALERATDELAQALRRAPEPDVEAAAVALEARGQALAILAATDPATRTREQAERLVRVLERDVEMSRALESAMAGIHNRVAALNRLSERVATDSPEGGPSTPPGQSGAESGVSLSDAARLYGNAPTANRQSRERR